MNQIITIIQLLNDHGNLIQSTVLALNSLDDRAKRDGKNIDDSYAARMLRNSLNQCKFYKKTIENE
jgi:hypothetical protein